MRRNGLLTRLTLCPVLVLAAAAGCSSTSRSAPAATAGPTVSPAIATGTLDDAIDDYNARRYQPARDRAARLADGGPSVGRDRASYVAGLAAWQLGDDREAETRLTFASRSGDHVTSGYAFAQLGLLHLRHDRPWQAATAFTSASEHLALDGATDAPRAAQWASNAFAQAGDDGAADRWRQRSAELSRQGNRPGPGGSSSPASVRPPSSSYRPESAGGHRETLHLPGGAFALQVGAFRERDRAERAAGDAEAVARRAGLGSVRITERPDDRRGVLYVVQVGDFRSRREADIARTRAGMLQYIVATLE